MTQTFPRKLQLIVMDWDGTLVSAEPMVHAAYVCTFKSLKDNRKWTIKDTHAKNGEDANLIFADKSLWGEKGNEARAIFYAHYNKLAARRDDLLQLKDGTKEFLDFLKTFFPDVKLALLAAKSQNLLEEEVHKFNLDSYFDAIVGKTDMGPNKPDFKVFDRIMTRLGITISDPRQEVMHIGDNPQKDEAFANSYGAMSVIVNENCSIKNLHHLRQEIVSVAGLTHPCFRDVINTLSLNEHFRS